MMDWSVIKDLGTFTLAFLIGIGAWLRIDSMDESLKQSNARIEDLEIRISTIVTKSHARVPSVLALDNERQIEVNKNDIEWLKRVVKYVNKKTENGN